ncbi:alpha/beta fold hydrolase [Methylobacterium platani]|uniref:Alpha/beta hydrolase n=2 Tax=Methylobacterium platani TaxID=427683 RepID=A0A179S286_9HYPH|nr:alpha/beta hydrolase [Methylobacterium platani]KMO11780.1 alpha/beta hydrolase [Methylobacterium platani JCM 14648]OAS19420.1 alpha/beta hydrolase [Methylobacterium platani]
MAARIHSPTLSPVAGLALAGAALLGAGAVETNRRARAAERATPPVGRFVEVGGTRLHVLERGSGPALVLLHGNGSLIQDWLVSGLVERAAETHRVVVVDRPGFGYSARPRSRIWTPAMQAGLIRGALHSLGVSEAVVLGHSWGTQVAIALALQDPGRVRALILESGYYFPTPRLDGVLFAPQGLPGLGDLVSHTVAPVAGRLLWPRILSRLFGPAPVPERFARDFPVEMVLRPSQLRSAAAESALLVPDAFALRPHYGELRMPVTILSGTGDRLVSHADQSAALHRRIPGSRLVAVEGAGHMLHHIAPDRILAAIAAASNDSCGHPARP